MSKKRRLQIDVKGPVPGADNTMECLLSVDGRDCTFYMSKADYEALIYDGVFVRDGNKKDSSSKIVNTTDVYVEE